MIWSGSSCTSASVSASGLPLPKGHSATTSDLLRHMKLEDYGTPRGLYTLYTLVTHYYSWLKSVLTKIVLWTSQFLSISRSRNRKINYTSISIFVSARATPLCSGWTTCWYDGRRKSWSPGIVRESGSRSGACWWKTPGVARWLYHGEEQAWSRVPASYHREQNC